MLNVLDGLYRCAKWYW